MSSNPPASDNRAGAAAEPFVFVAVNGETAGRSATPGWQPAGHLGSAGGLQAEQTVYEKGLAEGEARARASFEATAAALRGELGKALNQFAKQREGYFERVESEVVQLALSIARKILHREAQMDPLLLTGIVRVALDTLNAETQVRLRTNPQEILSWREYFSHADIAAPPELIGDASLDRGCCVLETDLGCTHISLETQLKEIEQGFLDLLEHRPRVRE